MRLAWSVCSENFISEIGSACCSFMEVYICPSDRASMEHVHGDVYPDKLGLAWGMFMAP